MEAQGEYLEEALGGEDADEAHVEVLEGEHPHLGLAVVVQRHGEHVQPDEDHDDHVELLVGDDPEDDSLRSPRRPGKSLQRLLGARLLHGGDVLLLVLGHEGVQAAALVLLLIELVDDDTDQEVEGEEGSKHDEGHEEEVAHHTVLVHGLLVQLKLEEQQIVESLPSCVE